MKRLTLVLALVGLTSLAWALPPGLQLGQLVVDHWNDRSGLPSNSVLDVLQDTKGYIWIASYDGLIRFDGRTFSVFVKDGASGFTSNSARTLLSAADGTLWIGTNTEGLFSFRDGAFTAWGKDRGLPDLSVRTLGYDGRGRLWAGTAGGPAVLENGTFRAFGAAQGIPSFFLTLGDGTLLFGSNKPGLWRTGPEGPEPYLPQLTQGEGALAATPVSAAFLDRRNQLWLGTATGKILVVQGNAVVKTLEPEGLKGGTVKEFYLDREGTLWVGTDKGLLYDRGDGFLAYTEANGLPNNAVTSLWQDREGSLWVGTDRGGLVKFSPGKFINVTQREGLVGNAVNAVVEDRWGTVWVASDQGLAIFPAVGDPVEADPLRKAAREKVLADLGKVRIRQIRIDAEGVLWFATYSDFGLYAFDGLKSTTLSQKDGLPVNRVRLSLVDRSGRLWIGTTAGLVSREAGGLRVWGSADGLKNDFILAVHEDATGAIWVGLDGGGLARLGSDGRFEGWTTADGLAGNVVFRVFPDAAGRVWVATSDGLSLVTDGGFRSWRNVDGLLSDAVYQIIQEPGGGLFWLVTSRGLQVLSPEALLAADQPLARTSFRVLDRLDGLAGQPSSNSWAFQNPQGVLYIPTIGGLSVYNPQSVSTNPTPPPVYIEALRVDDEAQALGGPLKLEAGARRLTVQFTALSYMVPQKVGFQYRLEGWDPRWVSAGGERTAVYTNLPAGNYTFRVRAWNNDGVVNEDGASVALVVEPRFYETPWFLILVALLLVALGFGVNGIRLTASRRRQDALERQVLERTEALNLEKQKSEALLRNVLPARVAEELKASGKSEPQVHAGVTVLIADLVSFTPTAAKLTPAQTIQELNDLFGLFDGAAARHGAERIKTIGDAWLGVAGMDGLDPAAAAQKMIEVATELLQILEDRRRRSPLAWQIRIGLHTGDVVGGVVGVERFLYDIFGDTVNTAFRMQAEAAPDTAVLSAATAALVAPTPGLVNRGLVEIKGKGPMDVYVFRP